MSLTLIIALTALVIVALAWMWKAFTSRPIINTPLLHPQVVGILKCMGLVGFSYADRDRIYNAYVASFRPSDVEGQIGQLQQAVRRVTENSPITQIGEHLKRADEDVTVMRRLEKLGAK